MSKVPKYLGAILLIATLIPIFIILGGVISTVYGILNSGLIGSLVDISSFSYEFVIKEISKVGLVDYALGFTISASTLAAYIYANFYAFPKSNNKLKFSERLNASVFSSIFIITAIRYSFYSVGENGFELITTTFQSAIFLLPLLTIIVFVKDYYENYNPEISIKSVLKQPNLVDAYIFERINQNTFLKPIFTIQNQWSSFFVGLIIVSSSGIASFYVETHILTNLAAGIPQVLLAILIISGIFGVIQFRKVDKIKDKKNRRIDEFY